MFLRFVVCSKVQLRGKWIALVFAMKLNKSNDT